MKTNRNQKKAQIQMGENIIILFIFFILLVFAIVFYTRIKASETSQRIEFDVEGRGLQIAQQVKFLPELQCSRSAVEVPDCYDNASAAALNELIREDSKFSDEYFDIFGYSTVSLQQIFPEEGDVLVVYNKSKENFTIKIPVYTTIIICDFVRSVDTQTCDFGVLKVEVFN